MIKATVLADSINSAGNRLTTFEVTFHRYILAEVNTHRVLSRNFRSSRAVPVSKLIQEVRENPAMPLCWQANKPGMVGGDDLSPEGAREAARIWLEAASNAADLAEDLARGPGVHKGIINRLLEPFMWAHGVISGTDWDNFFRLRLAPDAQPEFQALARAMRGVMDASRPQFLDEGEWHLPYADSEEREWQSEAIRKVCAARIARVSYAPHDGNPDHARELARAERLIEAGHWSPLEHVARADPDGAEAEGHRNFRGFVQIRSLVGG